MRLKLVSKTFRIVEDKHLVVRRHDPLLNIVCQDTDVVRARSSKPPGDPLGGAHSHGPHRMLD